MDRRRDKPLVPLPNLKRRKNKSSNQNREAQGFYRQTWHMYVRLSILIMLLFVILYCVLYSCANNRCIYVIWLYIVLNVLTVCLMMSSWAVAF